MKDKSIFLLDNVSFFDENYDFNLKSTELNGNLEKREFYSTKPIDFKMSSGFVKSDNFHYDENKQKVMFLGRTELVFFK